MFTTYNNENTAIITFGNSGWEYNGSTFNEPFAATEAAKYNGCTYFIMVAYKTNGELEVSSPEEIDAYHESVYKELDRL